jgi:hypothetical protein
MHLRCRHHLYLDVKANGSIIVNFPDLEPWELPETCSLDCAELGRMSLDGVGIVMNVGYEWVRRLEKSALEQLFGVIRRREI